MAFPKELLPMGVPPGQAQAMGGQYGALAALGSTQTDAALVVSSLGVISGADGTKGIILPAVEPGSTCTLFNNSGSTLKVYPNTGSAICVPGTGLGSANAAFSHLTYKNAIYTCITSTQWLVNVSA